MENNKELCRVKSYSENGEKGKKVDAKSDSREAKKKSKAVKFNKIFEDCYFCIKDVSVSYREYFEACKKRCAVSVVSFRSRLMDIVLKRGGGLEASVSPYVTHFVVERANSTQTWWIYRRRNGTPRKYHFVTAKYIVESHFKGRRLLEASYLPKFLKSPKLYRLPPSSESTPERGEDLSPIMRSESYRVLESWAQVLESEELEDFKSMEAGMYMDGNITYIHMENFLIEALMGRGLSDPAIVYSCDYVVSANSEAKKSGIRRGMHVKVARSMSAGLRMAGYNHERVMERGAEMVRLLKRYTSQILSPYYDEYYLQISYERTSELLGELASQDHEKENACKLASKIYTELPAECVMGVGKNMLISKLASKRCRSLKIDSQESECEYELSPVLSIYGMKGREWLVSENIAVVSDGFKFLSNVCLSEMPGVGVLWEVLKMRGLVTCNDVRKKGTPVCLQTILGTRVGKMVYNFCFGYDYRCSNLPRNQLDFFINKTFTSEVNLQPTKKNTQASEIRIKKEWEESDDANENSAPYKGRGQEDYESDRRVSHAGPEEPPVKVKLEEGSLQIRSNEHREREVLRSLLSDIMRQLCLAYSLFDRCIVNYSIKYKCNLELKVNGGQEYTKCMNSILEKESLKHTTRALFDEIKREFGIEISDMKTIQLNLKDVIRVEESIKFLDKFVAEKQKSPQRGVKKIKEEEHQEEDGKSNCKTWSEDSAMPSEEMCTPTRRLNGWRLDCIPSGPESSENSVTSTNWHQFMSSKSSPTRRRTIRSPRSTGSRRRLSRSRSESSSDSNQRSVSRSLRGTGLPEGQKYITEYISPTRMESK